VADWILQPASPLADLTAPAARFAGSPGVTLAERPGVALCSIMASRHATDALQARMRDAFGLDLPATRRVAVGGSLSLVWTGPAHWLALADGTAGPDLERSLRAQLAGLASVTDQSDGRTVLQVGGPDAPAALAKGVPIDLHPASFGPGSAASTTVGHIGVHFWQTDVGTYQFAVFRSFAASFCEWLLGAAAEFGVALEQPGAR
jgi:heterotetrameric sarcosine oxidase gamma subunit